jgi:hypothetical protein
MTSISRDEALMVTVVGGWVKQCGYMASSDEQLVEVYAW